MSDIYAGTELDTTVTGEAVALDLAAASVGVRALSGLVDVAAALVLLLAAIGLVLVNAPDAALAGVGQVLSIVVAWLVLPVATETLTRGRTLGKLVTGLRTVRDDGGPISFHHAFARHLVGVVEIWVFSGVPALVCAMVNPRGKRLGDLAAGTYVVRDRFRLQLPPAPVMPPHLRPWASGADVAPLPAGLALAVRQLLGRHASLDPARREALTRDLAAQVATFVAPQPPPGTAPVDFLAAVVVERRVRDARRMEREESLRHRLVRR